MSKEVTVCLTSCNRFSLLKQTLDSFFALNTYPIKNFIVTEDSGNLEMRQKILEQYHGKVTQLIFNEQNKGAIKSIDYMYNLVDTEYIFHSEDDWLYKGNPNFISNSIDILEERKDINQVWLRPIKALREWIEDDTFTTITGVNYRLVKNPHCGDWCGFSNNPGLRRLSDYKSIFPNGYASCVKPGQSLVFAEHECNLVAAKHGYRAAILVEDSCDHIGYGHSTYV